MAKLQPAMSPEHLYSNLISNGFSDRSARHFLRIPEFSQLKYKSHQVCFFYKYVIEELQKFISYATIGSIFEINKSTVSRNIKMHFQEQKSPGRHNALEVEIEKNIVEKIIECSNNGEPMTRRDVLNYVKELTGKSLSKGWLNCFIGRNLDSLKKGRSFPLEDSRMLVPREYLKQHLINMKKYVEGRMSELTFNLDEVGCSDWEDRKPKCVIIPKNTDSDEIFHSVDRSSKHISLLVCVSAAGDSLTPMMITNYEISDEIYENGLREDEDIMIRQRNPPYINESLFIEYLQLVLIPYINSVREKYQCPEKEAVLMMDSCSAHCTLNVMKLLGENKIIAFAFPSHTTNIFQALDLSLFGIFKRTKNQEDIPNFQKKLKKIIFKILQSYEKSATCFNIRGSFEKAGLTSDMTKKPRILKFSIQKVINNSGFKQLWNLNIKIEDLSKRRLSQRFGIINTDFLPTSCNIILNENNIFPEIEQLEEYFD